MVRDPRAMSEKPMMSTVIFSRVGDEGPFDPLWLLVLPKAPAVMLIGGWGSGTSFCPLAGTGPRDWWGGPVWPDLSAQGFGFFVS